MKVFFDTNVLVCLFDQGAPEKQRSAQERFRAHTRDGGLLLSTQLQEFYVTVTRKLSTPLGSAEALEAVRRFATFSVV